MAEAEEAPAQGDYRVPSGTPSLREVLELLQKGPNVGSGPTLICLEADHEEPQEPWPLELDAEALGRSLEVRGPPGRGAALRNVALVSGAERSVLLRGVEIRGKVSLSGQGCALEDCEVRHGLEVCREGAMHVKKCTVKAARHAVAVHGSCLFEENEVADCDIGVCLFGNPLAVVRKNTLLNCRIAGVVLHCSLSRDIDSTLHLAPTIDDNTIESSGRDIEVHVDVDGTAAMTFEEWPLPKGAHLGDRVRGGYVEVEVASEGVLRLANVDGPEPRRKKRKKAAPAARLASGPAWAREVLGMEDADFTMRQLAAAYRRKAREVHPDKIKVEELSEEEAGSAKQEPQSKSKPSAARFHELTAAYETLLKSLQDAGAEVSAKGSLWPRKSKQKRQ